MSEKTLDFRREGNGDVLRVSVRKTREGTAFPVLTFPSIDAIPGVRHIMTTRAGGVSTGQFATVNFSTDLGDCKDAVMENFRRAADVMGTRPDRIVSTHQTHTVNVRHVTEQDAGIGVTRELSYHDVDGLITDVPGLCLSVYYADCVPLFFVDPVHRAIGLSHSGWRGTVHRMGAVTIRHMGEAFGTKPEDLVCAVGPSICRKCYEVGGEVAEAFRVEFPGHSSELMDEKQNGKFQLDLRAANRRVLLDAGVPEENIQVTDICTCCNPELLHSHRASHGKRGNLGAFLMIEP